MAKITVLIPAYNAAATLAATLDSLVQQTFRDFDVLLVNDGSGDDMAAIAEQYRDRLPLQVHHLPQQVGVAGAANYGLARVTSPYIARIDADDLAAPERLEKQLAFMEAHPRVDVCGSTIELFYDDGSRPDHLLAKPAGDAAIKTMLVQCSALSNPSTMLRKSFFDDVGLYDARLDFAEDYDIWCRGALLGKRYANLPQALTRYRQHANQVGRRQRQLQFERDLAVKRKYLSALLDGAPCGMLAEFFSPLTVFSSREVAIAALEHAMPLVMQLSQKVADPALLGEIVSACVGRHVRQMPASIWRVNGKGGPAPRSAWANNVAPLSWNLDLCDASSAAPGVSFAMPAFALAGSRSA